MFFNIMQAVDHPYLVIHSDTQRDKGQDALVLAGANAAKRERASESSSGNKGGEDEDAEV
jgi:hypothetical protein